MRTGQKLHVEGFLRILDQIPLVVTDADCGLEEMILFQTREIRFIDYVLWQPEFSSYPSQGGFQFFLRNQGNPLLNANREIPYGPKVCKYVRDHCADRLYFRDKEIPQESVELRFYEFLEEYWKLGL